MTATSVYVFTAIFSFVASVVQCVAGGGEGILLQVLWFTAHTASPSTFGDTPLGADPVGAAAIILFVRMLFTSPLLVYLSTKSCVFSRSMTIMMAVPSTIAAAAGVLLFNKGYHSHGRGLRLTLGITCLTFAVVSALVVAARVLVRRRQVAALSEQRVAMTVEADAVAAEAQMQLRESLATLHRSFVMGVRDPGVLLMQPPAHHTLATTQPQRQQELEEAVVVVDARGPTRDPETGLPIGTTRAFVSTITGQPFVAAEAAASQLVEEHAPPLSPAALSPSRTLTFTRVRVNRNLDRRGKIQWMSRLGAAVAATGAGLLASLTGVSSPPQLLFALLYDIPSYMTHLNFHAQAVLGNLIRCFMAGFSGTLTTAQLPIFVVAVLFSYGGIFVGHAVGRQLGPLSTRLWELCVLLLASLVMVATSAGPLVGCTVAVAAVTAAVAVWERRRYADVIARQLAGEREVESRMYDVIAELKRSVMERDNNDDNDNDRNNTSSTIHNNFNINESMHSNNASAPSSMAGGRPVVMPLMTVEQHHSRQEAQRQQRLLLEGFDNDDDDHNKKNNSNSNGTQQRLQQQRHQDRFGGSAGATLDRGGDGDDYDARDEIITTPHRRSNNNNNNNGWRGSPASAARVVNDSLAEEPITRNHIPHGGDEDASELAAAAGASLRTCSTPTGSITVDSAHLRGRSIRGDSGYGDDVVTEAHLVRSAGGRGGRQAEYGDNDDLM